MDAVEQVVRRPGSAGAASASAGESVTLLVDGTRFHVELELLRAQPNTLLGRCVRLQYIYAAFIVLRAASAVCSEQSSRPVRLRSPRVSCRISAHYN